MKGKIFWVAAFISLVNSPRAFNMDSSLVLVFGLGHSSIQQPQYSEIQIIGIEGKGYGSLNLNASASWNTSWPLNYV